MEQVVLEQEIQANLAEKKYAIVEQFALQYMQYFPLQAAGYYYLSVCNFQQQRFQTAKENLEKALALNENYHEALFLLAETLMQLQEIKEAGKIFEKIALDPEVKDKLEVVLALCRFYLKHNQYDEALQQANKACKLAPNNASAFLQTSLVFEYAQNYKMALGAITKAVQLAPENIAAQLQFINIAKRSGKLDLTINAFEKLKELEPYNVTFLVSYIEVLMQLNKFEDAQKVLAHLSSFEADNIVTLKLKAKIALALKDYTKAANAFKSLLVFDAKDTETYLLAAEAYTQAYEYTAAIAILSDGINIDTLLNKELLLIKRAELFLKVYDYFRAENDYRLASQTGAYKGIAFLGLGKFYLQQNKNLDAFFALRSAEENAAYEATTLIQEHCQKELEMEAQEALNDLLAAYAPHIEANNNSPIIKEIASNYWRFDEQATLKKNPAIFKELPAEMSKTIIEVFASILVMIKPQGILMLNPKDTDMRGVYKIIKEDKNKLEIEVALIGTTSTRNLTFIKYPKFLSIDGFAEEISFELIFSPTNLNDSDKATFNERKAAGLLSYMSTSKA